MKTKESNKLIAVFMGAAWKYNRIRNYKSKYHTSWDWLMPVVEKIGDITYFAKNEGMREFLLINSKHITWYNSEFYICPDNIEHVYQAVVQFIQWYNENSK